MIYKNLQLNKGYTLLFAVLVSSVVLSIGISILTISKKEFQLSSSAKDSTIAFYAADSGLECAQYFNDNGDTFSTSTLPTVNSFSCNGAPITPTYTTNPFVFSFDFNINANSCARVLVRKEYMNISGFGNISVTTITSRGYNTGWNGTTCSVPSPRRVERALQLSY